MEIYSVLPERVKRESFNDFVFPIGCIYHGLSLPLEKNLAKLIVHLNCSLAEFPPLAMLIYERARQLENVFKVPFGYSELVRYFHLMPTRNQQLFRVDFFKKNSGPTGLPQNYSSWLARWFAAAGNWDESMPGRIPTDRRVQVSAVDRKLIHNKNAELNLNFYLEGIDPEWKKMQRPWGAVRRTYGKVKVKLVSDPYEEEIPSSLVEKESGDADSSDNSETSEEDGSDNVEVNEDDSDAAEYCEYESAEELDKAMTDIKNVMLEGTLSADEVMQGLRLGLVENDAAHDYVADAESIGTAVDLIDVSNDPTVLHAELAQLRA